MIWRSLLSWEDEGKPGVVGDIEGWSALTSIDTMWVLAATHLSIAVQRYLSSCVAQEGAKNGRLG